MVPQEWGCVIYLFLWAFGIVLLLSVQAFLALPILLVQGALGVVHGFVFCVWSWVFFVVHPVPLPLVLSIALIVDGEGFGNFVWSRTVDLFVPA